MDTFDSLLMMHSVGGGTGSGLGSLLMERLRDVYPSHYLTTCSILPFGRGETPLQHYNTTLTLAHLQHFSDAVLLFHNDTVLDLLSSLVHRGAGGKGAAPLPFAVLNSYIADCLANVLSPIPSSSTDTVVDHHTLSSWPALLTSLCPLPELKLLDTWTTSGLVVPTAHDPMAWSTVTEVMDRTCQHIMGGSTAGGGGKGGKVQGNKVIEFAVIARGESSVKMEQWDRQRMDERVGRHFTVTGQSTDQPPVTSQPRLGGERYAGRVGERLVVDGVGPSMSAQEASLSVVVNHARHVKYIKSTLSSARAMLEKRAYVHWYERFDCGEQQFHEAFDRVQQVINDYEEWTK